MRKKKLNKELMRRRDEVIERYKHACARTFPDHLLEEPMAILFEWIITPHIKKEYVKYRHVPPESDRGAENAVYKIMEVREKLNEESGKNKNPD